MMGGCGSALIVYGSLTPWVAIYPKYVQIQTHVSCLMHAQQAEHPEHGLTEIHPAS